MMLALVVVACLCGSTLAQFSPPQCASVNASRVTPAVPLPGLPMKKFKAVIRAVIINKNTTTEATEYVDEDYNAAAMHFNDHGKPINIIMHYDTNEGYYVEPNPSTTAGGYFCETKNLTTDDNTQLFGMSAGPDASGRPHLYSTAKILSFINGSETYKGQMTIDGIKVNKWSSCMYWSMLNATFSLDYYFTVPGWQTPSGIDQIPVRAEIQGTRSYPNGTTASFHHIYQYVNFEYYINDPEGVFNSPPGVYCIFRQKVKPIPTLKNHFYYREEITDTSTGNGGYGILSEADIWYDYDLQLLRYDARSPPTGISQDFSNSKGPFSTIHDYGSGVQYTIDRYTSLCSIDPIPLSARGFDAVNNITRQSLGMRDPKGFFNLNDMSYVYAGQRKARGVQTDVFQAVLTNIPNRGVVVYEVYFLTPQATDITDRGSQSQAQAAIPLRIMEWEDGSLITEYNIHDFDQESPTYDKFDVAVCFHANNAKDFELFMNLKPSGSGSQSYMNVMSPYLDSLIHMNMALSMGVTPIRVQNTRMHWDWGHVYYQATLIGAPPTIAKYEKTSGKTMATTAGKAIPNVAALWQCAQKCDQLQEWTCKEFDYCPTTKVCTLAKRSDTLSPASSLLANSACDHYTNVLGANPNNNIVALDQAWITLRDLVYANKLVFELPLPDANGNVDLNVDTSTLDMTQKLSFTGYLINDEVIAQSSVQRNPATGLAITQFSRIPNHIGKGIDFTIRGVSVDDCAMDCVGEMSFSCQSFHYCAEAGTCFLSRTHPDEQPDSLKWNKNCDTYYRNYTAGYQKFKGLTALPNTDTIYQSVVSPNQCAKLCTYYKTFHCESFDFCANVNTCFLGRTHYYNIPEANKHQQLGCSHYSRNYLADFVAKYNKVIPMRDNLVTLAVTAQECARQCVTQTGFQCNSFDYCANTTECRLSSASLSSTGQTTMETSAQCDVYQRQYSSGTSSGQTAPKSSGYSGSSMGGLAIAMIVVGLLLGVVGVMLFFKFRGGGGGDGMNIAFSRHQESDG